MARERTLYQILAGLAIEIACLQLGFYTIAAMGFGLALFGALCATVGGSKG